MKRHNWTTLLTIFIMMKGLLGGEIVSFPSGFPDPQLQGRKFEMSIADAQESRRLGDMIVEKKKEADDHVRNCEPNSKDWKKDAEKWNRLRGECYAMMKQLRAIVANYNDYTAPAYTPPLPASLPPKTRVEPPPTKETQPQIDKTPWRKLRIGITRNQVKESLGEPTKITVISEFSEYWYYDSAQPWKAYVRFDRKGVSGWSEP